MGLSGEERLSKIYYSISAIVKESDSLKENIKLKSLIDELWFSLLGTKGNSGFWLMGSDFGNSMLRGTSFLGIAFKKHTYSERENNSDPLEWFTNISEAREYTEAKSILANEDLAIYNINLWAENLIYALCRYDDEMTKGLENLNKLVRKIQGELFTIFSSNDIFYKTWLTENIFKKCFSYKEDFVNQWLAEHFMYNKMPKGDSWEYKYLDSKILLDIYTEIQYKEELSLQKRFECIFAVVVLPYSSIDKIDSFIKTIDKFNENTLVKEKISAKKISKILKSNFKKYYRSPEDQYSDVCAITGNYKIGKEVKNIHR